MNAFDQVVLAFTTDYWMWVVLYNATLTFILGWFLWREKVGCALHMPYYHKGIAVMFWMWTASFADRFWNHGRQILSGGALPPYTLIDTEILVGCALTAVVFMAGYDYWRNKMIQNFQPTEEFHVPCDGCSYKPPRGV